MGIFSSLFGKDSAEASRRAAADTYGKQVAATNELKGFGDQYAGQFRQLSEGYDPYVQTGYSANSALQRLMSDPSSIRTLPNYQSGFDAGSKAITGNAAARGMLNSSSTLKNLQRFGSDYENQRYNERLAQLMGMSGAGQGALGAQNATVGAGLQGQLGTRQTAYGGQMNSASTIGMGDVAAAQAQQSALTNLLGMGAYLGGSYLGGGKKLF